VEKRGVSNAIDEVEDEDVVDDAGDVRFSRTVEKRGVSNAVEEVEEVDVVDEAGEVRLARVVEAMGVLDEAVVADVAGDV